MRGGPLPAKKSTETGRHGSLRKKSIDRCEKQERKLRMGEPMKQSLLCGRREEEVSKGPLSGQWRGRNDSKEGWKGVKKGPPLCIEVILTGRGS